MKYKLNGEWIDVNIKALDSMPVGAIVEYDGQVSDIPNGWQAVSGGKIKKTSETTPTMASVVNTQSDSTEDTYSCDFINGKVGKTIWTNSNPTGSFSSQTIPINNFGEYSSIEIIYIAEGGATWGRQLKTTGIMEKQTTYSMVLDAIIVENTSSATLCSRKATLTSTGVTFGTGYNNVGNTGATTRDYACIPYKIKGYK